MRVYAYKPKNAAGWRYPASWEILVTEDCASYHWIQGEWVTAPCPGDKWNRFEISDITLTMFFGVPKEDIRDDLLVIWNHCHTEDPGRGATLKPGDVLLLTRQYRKLSMSLGNTKDASAPNVTSC
jgi:hypothetical protein